MTRHRVVVEVDTDWLVGHVPALPGVASQGRDEAELRLMVLDALHLMVDDAEARGDFAFVRAAGPRPWTLDLETPRTQQVATT